MFMMLTWLVFTPLIRHGAIFTASLDPTPEIREKELLAGGIHGIAMLVPIAIAWWFNRRNFTATVFQTWFLAAIFHLTALPAYLTAIDAAQAQMIFIALATMCMLVVHHYLDAAPKNASEEPGSTLAADSSHVPWYAQVFGVAVIFSFALLPWLRNGALGSPLDTLLALLLSVSLGMLYLRLIAPGFRAIYRKYPNSTPIRVVWQLLHAGMTAYLLSSALTFHFSGMQLLLLFFTPMLSVPLSFLPFRLENSGTWKDKVSPALLSILSIALPLVFFDADELVLVLNVSMGEVFFRAFQAVLVTNLSILAATIALAIVYRMIRGRFALDERGLFVRASGYLLLAILWLCALFAVGKNLKVNHPGFYGERYFVIFKDQAPIASLASISDITQRKIALYHLLVEHALRTQLPIRNQLEQWGVQYHSFYLVNAMEVEGNPFLRLWLQRQESVDRILNSPVLRPLPQPPVALSGEDELDETALWNLKFLHVHEAWQRFGAQGEGIIIGHADSGVDFRHLELFESYRGYPDDHTYNWYDPWNQSPEPVDDNGHGTHTLAIIVGKNVGIAPKAKWIACTNLERNLANPALYLECMQFLFAPFPPHSDAFRDGKPELGAHILNNSWGCPEIEGCDTETFAYALQVFHMAGVFFVASAGNDGPDCGSLKYPPPIYPQAFAVGAIDANGNLAEFSSIGPALLHQKEVVKPDLLAPGVDILSALPGDTYGMLSGTSMAGPHVVGVVALLWSAFPQLIGDLEATQTILIESAQPYQGWLPACPGAAAYPSIASGYGVLDAAQALLRAQEYFKTEP